jgi:transposase
VECKTCGGVKQENLSFLAPNTKFTDRFAWQSGGCCRAMAVHDGARRMPLEWHTVKALDKISMCEHLRRGGPSTPSVSGVDEISVTKRHGYRIVVRDLEQKRALWCGGDGRTEKDMDMV